MMYILNTEIAAKYGCLTEKPNGHAESLAK
jgi:hypothetical protein